MTYFYAQKASLYLTKTKSVHTAICRAVQIGPAVSSPFA